MSTPSSTPVLEPLSDLRTILANIKKAASANPWLKLPSKPYRGQKHMELLSSIIDDTCGTG